MFHEMWPEDTTIQLAQSMLQNNSLTLPAALYGKRSSDAHEHLVQRIMQKAEAICSEFAELADGQLLAFQPAAATLAWCQAFHTCLPFLGTVCTLPYVHAAPSRALNCLMLLHLRRRKDSRLTHPRNFSVHLGHLR